jgi:hypothetical protein
VGGSDDLRGDPPRTAAAVKKILGRFAPWWGFAVYGVFWAFLAGTVIAVIVGAVLELLHRPDPDADPKAIGLWLVNWAISYAIVAPLFTRWVVHRRRYLARLARDGTLVHAKIVSRRRRWLVAFLLRLGRRAHKTQLLAVAGDFGTYRVAIAGNDDPFEDGAIDLIVHAEMREALALAPAGVPAIARRSSSRT